MNICIFHHKIMNPERGGIARVSTTLAAEFESRGNTVFFLAAAQKDEDGVAETVPRQYFLPSRKRDSEQNRIFLEQFLREHKIEAFIFQDGDDGVPLPAPETIKEAGVKLIFCIHNDPEFYKNKIRAKFIRKYGANSMSSLIIRAKSFFKGRKLLKSYRENSRVADATILLSQAFVPAYKKIISQKDREKIFAIGNPAPFPPQNIDLTRKKKELLFVGRMDNGQKCVDWLLKIWAKLENAFPEWQLKIVGGGEYLPALKKLASQMGGGHVHFEGFRKPEAFYRDAAIFCMTSAFEGFPMVLTESAAFGCVPVAFDSFAAVHDIIDDGENGRLVPAFDLDKYAETLAGLMSDDALRERLARNAQSIPEKFSPERIVTLWEKLLEKNRNQK